MLDAYIKIEDIRKLLDEVESTNGLIKRSDFQKAIIRLEECQKPIIKPKMRIKNRQALISMIEKHINDVQKKRTRPEIVAHLEHLVNMSLINRKVELFETDFWDEEDIKEKVDISIIALNRGEIMQILHISKPTYLRFEKLGIFKKYEITISVYVSGILRLSRHSLCFYNLNDIAKILSI